MRVETFALFFGIGYLGAGLLGLTPAALQPAPAGAPPVLVSALYGYLLGIFPVNVVHSVVHLVIGAWGVAAARGLTSPKLYARAIAIVFGVLAVLGAIPATGTLFGIVPLHGHDIWLHAVTSAVAAYFGWRPAASVERRAEDRHDRREHDLPIDNDRRQHRDRRLPASEI